MKKGFILLLIVIVGFLYYVSKQRKQPVTECLETSINVPDNGAIQESGTLVHLACIMDGNRRWAHQRGLDPWQGHQAGIEVARKTLEFCIEKNIKYLTLYILSPENLRRSKQELDHIFDLMAQEAHKGVAEFRKQGVRVRFKGDRSLFPSQLIPLLDDFEAKTADMDTITVTLLFCYGARQEIALAVKNIARQIKEGQLQEDDICPELIAQNLLTADIPDPDLIIRTGKVSRLSNFLLFQAAYSELYMLDCLWPDVTKEHLEQAYQAYFNTKRTFGT